jgi:serine/threonine protein kinase
VLHLIDGAHESRMGTVYHGVRKSDGVPVALKFFGYTRRAPSDENIREEIRVMMELRNVDGVVHLHGTFLDSQDGYIRGKKFPTPRPVLVMDFLEGWRLRSADSLTTPPFFCLSVSFLAGGDLCDRITQMTTVSEMDLANIFRQILLALEGIHAKGYVHRDLKLENIMLLTQEADSPIRLIDFGMMVALPDKEEVLVTKLAMGTPGYIAPESIHRHEYSAKSDVWQAGCCLYNLLSGHFPFDPDNPSQITNHAFFPMVGEDWDFISDSAKKMVELMLQRNPAHRPSIATLLQHSWMVGAASPTDLGKRYSLRIKHLSLRRKLRKFFVNNDLNMASQKKKLQAAVPSLRLDATQPVVVSPIDTFGDPPSPSPSPSLSESRSISQEKLDTFKALMMTELQGEVSPGSAVPRPGASPERKIKKEVSFETFCSVLQRADLRELATESVFAIFDSNNTGPSPPPSCLTRDDRHCGSEGVPLDHAGLPPPAHCWAAPRRG